MHHLILRTGTKSNAIWKDVNDLKTMAKGVVLLQEHHSLVIGLMMD